VTPTVVVLIVILGACVVGVRRLVPERIYFFQGMFRYETDLGWPHGVQEDDGERAWGEHQTAASDPEGDARAASDAMACTSTIVELEDDRDSPAVATVRVRADFSRRRRVA
jgi:hypothetical protein